MQRKAVIYGIKNDIRNGLHTANQIKMIAPSDYTGSVSYTHLERLNDFVYFSEVEENCIRKYSEKIPTELLEIWKEYGFGTFFGGYLKVINPDDYMDLLKESYFRGDVSIPILATAFGDIITWEEGKYIDVYKRQM